MTTSSASRPDPFGARLARMERTRERMSEVGVDVLLLSLGADLPWLCGYEAMPLERLTMLVVPREGPATLVVPALEAPRVRVDERLFTLRPWRDGEDAVAVVSGLAGAAERVAVSDRTWAAALLELQRAMPKASFSAASRLTAELRSVKDASEIANLQEAAQAADRVASQLLSGDIPLIGRTEAQVSAELGRRLIAEGHEKVNFAIVASGPNSASPHHDPSSRRIRAGDVVVCDFGGTMSQDGLPGYCSDITRTVATGTADPRFLELYSVLQQAQSLAASAPVAGMSCEELDQVARGLIQEAGFGQAFLHRLGHGIGMEEHEDPYIVTGNDSHLRGGNVFSVEPGIYLEGLFGARIEDIVALLDSGPQALNRAEHDLAIVEA